MSPNPARARAFSVDQQDESVPVSAFCHLAMMACGVWWFGAWDAAWPFVLGVLLSFVAQLLQDMLRAMRRADLEAMRDAQFPHRHKAGGGA